MMHACACPLIACGVDGRASERGQKVNSDGCAHAAIREPPGQVTPSDVIRVVLSTFDNPESGHWRKGEYFGFSNGSTPLTLSVSK